MAMRKAVTSIPEYAEWVEQVFVQSTDRRGYYEAPWFRGIGDARFRLLPGLYRSPEGKTKFADDELRSEFSRKALPLVVLQVSNADKFVAERLWCVLRLPNRKGCR